MSGRHAMLLISIVGASGCLSTPFVRSDGPVSAEGVTVSLVGQRCDFSPDFNGEEDEDEGSYPNRLDLEIRIAIRNDTHETLTVLPKSFRLVGADKPHSPVGPPRTLRVEPGAKIDLNVRFEHRGDVGCNASLGLILANGILVGDRPLGLRPVSFIPSATES
jgi:hypothetical protein